MTVGERLRELRTGKKLSREQLAALVHISVPALYTWENGRSLPSLSNAMVLADFYDVSLDCLVGRETPPE